MADASLIPIGASITVLEALNKTLGVLYDANLATYEIESDGDWRLLHIRCSRGMVEGVPGPWGVSLENAKLNDLQKIYAPYTGAEYDPPRIVSRIGEAVPENIEPPNNDVSPPYVQEYAGGEPIYYQYPYPEQIGVASGGFLPLQLVTQKMFTLCALHEIGTYIIPIAYHRNTDGGVAVEQVVRSDVSFWPMPSHAAWSYHEKIIGLEASTTLPPPSPEPPPE